MTHRRPHAHTARRAAWALLASAGVAVASAPFATAAPLAVSPTLVAMAPPAKTSDLVSLTNQGEDTARFQVTVASWEQQANGEPALTPTDDILVYPPLLSIGPGETKRVRVGTTVAAGDVEKSYRLIVQELPAVQPIPGATTQIQILTKLSLPIFVQPKAMRVESRIDAVALAGGVLSFAVGNSGTGHAFFTQIRVRGADAGGQATFDLTTPGWYVLPSGRRDYRVELGAAECRRSAQITVEAVEVEERSAKVELAVPQGACGGAGSGRFLDAAPR